MLPELHSILNLLEGGFRQLKVLVVGDIMLDRYIHGEVERISPEAPVPVIRHAQRYERAGGAANVAMNLAGLGCRAGRARRHSGAGRDRHRGGRLQLTPDDLEDTYRRAHAAAPSARHREP